VFSGNFAEKGSADLYQIRHHQIESNGLKWVRDNPDYWELGTIPEYKGENKRS